jgi:hypothetical protein
MNRAATSLLAVFLLGSPLVARAVPSTVAFSARLADNGKPITGSHSFVFKFFDAPTGGTELWGSMPADAPVSLTVTDGVVTYALGTDNAIPTDVVFNGLPVFLEVSFDGATLSPRVAIQTVPYAFHAGTADVALSTPFGGSAKSGGRTFNGFFSVATTVASVTVTFPTSGTAFILGKSNLSNFGQATVNYLNCNLREDGLNVAGAAWTWQPDGDPNFGVVQTDAQTKTVSAGTHAYAVVCTPNTGSIYASNGQLHVIFVPNALP